MVLEKVKTILSEQFDVEEDSISPETSIIDDWTLAWERGD